MKQGDFSKLAKYYHNRPAYSPALLKAILKIAGIKPNSKIADVGAGTGKLTAMLKDMASGASVVAVEPNDAMREEGKKIEGVSWLKGSAESTGLASNDFDLVFMASSFHWSEPSLSLPEFKRILKNGGYFCAIWNPREIEAGSVFEEIESEINAILPNLKRVSSGTQNSKNWQEIITSTGDFKECIYMSVDYSEIMDKERYLGAWQSVNDIQAQAGELWQAKIMPMIKSKILNLNELEVKYKIKAYLAQAN